MWPEVPYVATQDFVRQSVHKARQAIFDKIPERYDFATGVPNTIKGYHLGSSALFMAPLTH